MLPNSGSRSANRQRSRRTLARPTDRLVILRSSLAASFANALRRIQRRPQGWHRESHRPGAVRGRSHLSRHAARAHGSLDDSARPSATRSRSTSIRPASPSSIIATFPGRNIVDLIEQDQPFLVERDVRHMAEPILLLAHENAEVAARGARRRSSTTRTSRCSIPSDRRRAQAHRHRQGRRRRRARAAPTSSSKGRIAPDIRSTSTSRRTA